MDREHLQVYELVLNQLTRDINLMHEQAYSWQGLAEMMVGLDLVELWNEIPLNIFKKIFAAIFEYYPNTGTYESHISIISAITSLPKSAITITTVDLNHIQINIDKTQDDTYYWTDKRELGDYMTTNDGDYLVFNVLFDEIPSDTIERIIRAVTPEVIKVDLNIVEAI